jgi:hypothetical protein
MTEFHWPLAIVRICQWKEIAAEKAPDVFSPWSLPKLAAKPEAIAAAEAVVGFKFPEAYRGFLRHANGWDGAYVALNLFGTPDFLSGRAAEVLKRPGLVELLAKMGFAIGQYLVLGAGDPKYEADVILLIRPDNHLLPGGIVWINAEDISDSHQFASFEDFFLALVDYNEGTAQYAAIRAKGGELKGPE